MFNPSKLPPLAGSLDELDAQMNERFDNDQNYNSQADARQSNENEKPEVEYLTPSDSDIELCGFGVSVFSMGLPFLGVAALDKDEQDDLTNAVANVSAQFFKGGSKVIPPKLQAFGGLALCVIGIATGRKEQAFKAQMRDVTPQPEEAQPQQQDQQQAAANQGEPSFKRPS